MFGNLRMLSKRKVLILVSGPHGAGKTSIAKAIAEQFKLRYLSAGAMFRQKAKELGMDPVSFTRYVEEHPEIDYEIDDTLKEELKKGNAVFDSQLAYYFAKFVDDPDIIKISIMIYASFNERVKRLMKREKISYEDAVRDIKVREKSEQDRFKRLYGVDLWTIDDFDFVVNTTFLGELEAINLVTKIVKVMIEIKMKNSK